MIQVSDRSLRGTTVLWGLVANHCLSLSEVITPLIFFFFIHAILIIFFIVFFLILLLIFSILLLLLFNVTILVPLCELGKKAI